MAGVSGLLPCPTCPWRIDQGADVIPRYNHGLACNLINTTGEEDGFRPVMACHASPVDSPVACRGYLAMEGDRNLNVRILLLEHHVQDPDEIYSACEAAGIKLHPDYKSVLEKLDQTKGASR